MNFTDIKTWVVSADHKARPKNPNRKPTESHYYQRKEEGISWGDYLYKDWQKIEQECKDHTYSVDETLALGEYPAEIFGDVVWQYSVTRGMSWEFEIDEDTHRDSLIVGLPTRQFLPLKQIDNQIFTVIPPDSTSFTVTDKIMKEAEGKEQGGEWISVKDKLPELGLEVLLLVDFSGKYKIGFLNINNEWYIYETGGSHKLKSVSYWHELPSPPKSI